VLASALVVGLAIGVAATIFGYSNLATVDVHWSVFHVDGAPLWTVAVVPLSLVLVAGTIYHWMDGLHHFTEHMRHRRRVHELEAEITSLRSHLDHVLEMPDHSTSRLASKPTRAEPLPPVHETDVAALPEPVSDSEAIAENGTKGAHNRSPRPKRASEPTPVPVAVAGVEETAPTESAPGA
jgi:hypothetical protein